jgi:hypothetical protein
MLGQIHTQDREVYNKTFYIFYKFMFLYIDKNIQ